MTGNNLTIEERVARIDAIIDEGIPQRARMIAQLDRIEARQMDQAAIATRVTNLEEDVTDHNRRLNSHERVILNHENFKNRMFGVMIGVGSVSGIASTVIANQVSKAFEKFFKVFS